MDDAGWESESQADNLGLAQSALTPWGDPLAFARERGLPTNGLSPGLGVQGAVPAPIHEPGLAGAPRAEPQAPRGNGLSPLVQQQTQQPETNGLFGNINQLMEMKALQQQRGLQQAPQAAVAQQASSQLPSNTPYSADVLGMIQKAAVKRGIDPNVAVAVFRSEGAGGYTGDDGSSFGPFQFHMGGISKKFPHPGVGDQFKQDTGLDPRDPRTVPQQIEYAMDHAAKNGWGDWSGSRESAGRFLGLPTEGIGEWYGIKKGQAPAGTANATPNVPKGPLAGAPSGPFSGNDKLDKFYQYALMRAAFPQFEFRGIQYDPWAVHRFGVGGGY